MQSQIIRNDCARRIRETRRILQSGRSEPIDEMQLRDKRLLWVLIGLGVMVFVALFSGCAYSYTQEQAINAVIGEAEGEPQIGKEAVACAIHNRGYLTGVYGLHAPRVVKHMYSPHTYKMARQAVIVAKDQGYCEGLVNGAQYWASLKVDQSWIHKMLAMGYVHTATYGGQAFFRKN